jgi:acyl-CoA hydrolase/RimJ/RimL family protein N-acetyltransferase
MSRAGDSDWQQKLVTPDRVLQKLEPGASIFIGTAAAEPRTLVRQLMESKFEGLQDLEIIQLAGLGDALLPDALHERKYRLKTFFSGGVAADAITEGKVDLIPRRFSQIPELFASGRIPIDAAFVQITPPDQAGYCSLGVAVDVARQAMEKASLKVGEIDSLIPRTYGDTFVHPLDFDYLVESTEEPVYFQRWPVYEAFDAVAANVAAIIEDRSCIAFSIGPLFDALTPHLAKKRHLGVHSPFVTDALMDLIESGAVSNRYKEVFRGKSLVSYALGTPELMKRLDSNPFVEFQGIDKVCAPVEIGRNPRFVTVVPARKVDLSSRIALHFGKGSVAAGPGEAIDFINGADISPGGFTVFALPSRNRSGEPNIRLSVEDLPNEFNLHDSVDMVVTDYGVAALRGRTVRERAQALIDVAHPDDRPSLVEQAREHKIIYRDQIFLTGSAHFYPAEIASRHTFKGGLQVRFRAIKPSDEEEMRRLFYRFSDEAVYYRYFSPIKSMPHAKMQTYVNIDYRDTLSIVGLLGDIGQERIIAEGRFVKDKQLPYAEVAFVVDEQYQGRGIATHIFRMLVTQARQRGLQGLTANVLTSNQSMLKVIEKAGLPTTSRLEEGVYEITISL